MLLKFQKPSRLEGPRRVLLSSGAVLFSQGWIEIMYRLITMNDKLSGYTSAYTLIRQIKGSINEEPEWNL